MFQNFIISFGLLAVVAAKGFKSDKNDFDLQALIEHLQEDRESGHQHYITHGKVKDDRSQMPNIKTLNLLFKNNKRQKHEVENISKNNAIDRLMCDITGGGGCGQDDSLDRSDDSRSDDDKFDEVPFAEDYYREEDNFNYDDDPLVNEAKYDLQSLINDLEEQISSTERKESSDTDVLQCQGSRCDLTFDSNDSDLKEYLRCKKKCSGTSEVGGNLKDDLLCRRNCYATSGVDGVDLTCQKKCSGRSGSDGDQKSHLRCRRICAARSRSDRDNGDYERAGKGNGNIRCSGNRCGIQFDDRDNDMMDYLRCRKMCFAHGETDENNDLRCRQGCYGRSGALRDDPSGDLSCRNKCQNARSGGKEQYLRCRRECATARSVNPVYITVDEHHRARTFRTPTDYNANVIDCKMACFDGNGQTINEFMQCTDRCMPMDITKQVDKTRSRGLRCRGPWCDKSRINKNSDKIDNNLKDVLDKYGKRYRLNSDLDAVVLDVDNIGDLLESLEITVDESSFEDKTRMEKMSSNRPKYKLSSEVVANVPRYNKFIAIEDGIFDTKQSKPIALDVNQKKLSLPEFLEGVSNIRDIPLDILLNYIVDPRKNSWKAHIEQRGLSVSPEDADYLQYLKDNFQKFTDSEKAYLPILENVLQNNIALSNLEILPAKRLEKKNEVAYIQNKPAKTAKADSIKDKVPVHLWDQILSRTKLRSLLPLTQQQKLKMRIPGKLPGDHSRYGRPGGMHSFRK